MYDCLVVTAAQVSRLQIFRLYAGIWHTENFICIFFVNLTRKLCHRKDDRDAPTKVNKQPHLHLGSRDSRMTQLNRQLDVINVGVEQTFVLDFLMKNGQSGFGANFLKVKLLCKTWLLCESARLMQHRHGSEDIRVVFYQKAVAVPTME